MDNFDFELISLCQNSKPLPYQQKALNRLNNVAYIQLLDELGIDII